MPCLFALCLVLGYETSRLVSLVIGYLYCFRIRTPEVRKPCFQYTQLNSYLLFSSIR